MTIHGDDDVPEDIRSICELMKTQTSRAFPRYFEYNDSGRTCRHELFGSTVERVHDVVKTSDPEVLARWFPKGSRFSRMGSIATLLSQSSVACKVGPCSTLTLSQRKRGVDGITNWLSENASAETQGRYRTQSSAASQVRSVHSRPGTISESQEENGEQRISHNKSGFGHTKSGFGHTKSGFGATKSGFGRTISAFSHSKSSFGHMKSTMSSVGHTGSFFTRTQTERVGHRGSLRSLVEDREVMETLSSAIERM
eukprot:TRINITY_DN16807_c0_g2_i2.p1 TRINITY_DN16807_c0_g2~~TRINITY_DN16807_c0_g2_i2.p1  ORF type:complete len:254 (+),score=20.59 TRINITY_DN16807_c0_g2_i2:55-816(+)